MDKTTAILWVIANELNIANRIAILKEMENATNKTRRKTLEAFSEVESSIAKMLAEMN